MHDSRDALEPRLESDAVTFRLRGTFDPASARALAHAIARVPAPEVRLDFSQVRTFLALAVPVLTRSVPASRLRILGLSRQHERVFEWFGVPPGEPTTHLPELAAF